MLSEYISIMETACKDFAKNPKVLLGALPYSDKQVMYLCADISCLKNDVGFMPKTSFENGINKTIEYIMHNPE